MSFGDGSNEWISGTQEFLADPGQAVRDPYDTVAGAADAGALNFDEGVGGLTSLVDNQPGNTAGAGDSSIWSLDPQHLGGFQVVLFGALAVVGLWLIRPLLEIAAAVVD